MNKSEAIEIIRATENKQHKGMLLYHFIEFLGLRIGEERNNFARACGFIVPDVQEFKLAA